MNRSLATHPLFVGALWLTAYCVSIAIVVENVLGDAVPGPGQLLVKLMAYLGAAVAAGIVFAATVLFGCACALMLKWLGEPLPAQAVARRVAGAFWVLVSYAWLMVGLVVAYPPRSLALDEAIAYSRLDLEKVFGFVWLTEAQYVVMGLFPTILFWLLARRCAWLNALLAVAFGTLLTSVVALALPRLAHLSQV